MPDDASEVVYYRRRALAETRAADCAATPQSAGLHRDLARLFEDRAALHHRQLEPGGTVSTTEQAIGS